MLFDALKRAFENSTATASIAVVVDSKSPQAHAFHSEFGFISFPETRGRLFLPMKTIEQLLKS